MKEAERPIGEGHIVPLLVKPCSPGQKLSRYSEGSVRSIITFGLEHRGDSQRSVFHEIVLANVNAVYELIPGRQIAAPDGTGFRVHHVHLGEVNGVSPDIRSNLDEHEQDRTRYTLKYRPMDP